MEKSGWGLSHGRSQKELKVVSLLIVLLLFSSHDLLSDKGQKTPFNQSRYRFQKLPGHSRNSIKLCSGPGVNKIGIISVKSCETKILNESEVKH